ncbi:MAG: TIGR03013 family XrtA/PEP-CTERM system glycosyltransferase [Pseudomonadota bacterium]
MAIRLFDHYISLPVAILVVTEMLVTSAAICVGTMLAVQFGWVRAPASAAIETSRILAVCGVLFLSLAAMGLYRIALRATFAGVAARVITAVVLTGVALPFVYYFFRNLYLTPGTLTLSSLLALAGLLGVRYLFLKLVDESLFKRRILVLGAGKRAEQFLQLRRQSDQRGFKLVRFIAMVGDEPSEVPKKRVRPFPTSLIDYCRRHEIDEIVIALDDRRGSLPIRELLECRLESIDITDVMNFLERETGKLNLNLVSPSWLIFENGFRRQLPRRIAQRVFDVLSSSLVLILASPIMLITAVLILLEDGRPIFYRQRRVGQGNTVFNVLKFRSMRTDAEAGGKAIWAKKDDDRITRVGNVIRKLRIDELPQLINVLAGTMSVVGPRPERPEFVETLSEQIPYYLERHRVRPGITGWAQLCYPYGSSEKDAFEKLQYDLYYVKNRTLVFDFMILLQTAEVVLWQKGAR